MKHNIRSSLYLCIIFVAFVTCISILFIYVQEFPGRAQIKIFFTNQVAHVDTFGREYKDKGIGKNVIYILGGNRNSLREKMKTAASMYRNGYASRILFLSEPDIKRYDRNLGTSITGDGWVIKTLTEFGVHENDIEPVPMEFGFFGTYSEARHISRLAEERKYRNIVLVTSRPHTMRVWKSFSRNLYNRQNHIYMVATEEKYLFRHVILECIKLFVYEVVLL